MEATQIENHGDIVAVLQACCLKETPLTMRWISSEESVAATFTSVGRQSLQVKLASAVDPALHGDTCYVVFCHGRASYLFFTRIVERGETSSHVSLTLPERMAVERRSELRVPMDAGLEISLASPDGGERPGQPRNLSLTGLSVEFAPNHDIPTLIAGDAVTVQLKLPGEHVQLEGRVRRREGSVLAIAFEPGKASEKLRSLYSRVRQQHLTRDVIKSGQYVAGATVAIPAEREPEQAAATAGRPT